MNSLFGLIASLRLRYGNKALSLSAKEQIEKDPVTGNLSIAYILALSIVAGLSVVSHTFLDQILKRNTSSATIIYVASRQLMLSQRIGLYAKAFMNRDSGARDELEQLAALMEQSHQALIRGNGDLGITIKLSPEASAIYFQQPLDLDRRTRQFLNHTQLLLSSEDPIQRQKSLQQIRLDSMTQLLNPLEQAVKQFEVEANARITLLRRVQGMVLIIVLITLGLEARLIFRPLVIRVQQVTHSLLKMAMRDELTGLLNRRSFLEISEREIHLAYREEKPLTLLMADIDHFKQINDTYGHAVGDEVIKKFAEVTLYELRKTDIIARIGGEEFAIVLVNSNQKQSIRVAERLRAAIANTRVQVQPELEWTVSIGLAELSPSHQQISPLMKQADQALYIAKEKGRNQVRVVNEVQVSA